MTKIYYTTYSIKKRKYIYYENLSFKYINNSRY